MRLESLKQFIFVCSKNMNRSATCSWNIFTTTPTNCNASKWSMCKQDDNSWRYWWKGILFLKETFLVYTVCQVDTDICNHKILLQWTYLPPSPRTHTTLAKWLLNLWEVKDEGPCHWFCCDFDRKRYVPPFQEYYAAPGICSEFRLFRDEPPPKTPSPVGVSL